MAQPRGPLRLSPALGRDETKLFKDFRRVFLSVCIFSTLSILRLAMGDQTTEQYIPALNAPNKKNKISWLSV
jgi:hypothetical protein